MFKYTKSLVTAALALTCSLSLVSCGGGGGGGGEAETPDNSGTTNNSGSNSNSSNNNTSSSTTTDYAWASGRLNAHLKGAIYDFHLSSDGSVVIKRAGNYHDGTYTYTRTGVNSGSLYVYSPKSYPEYTEIKMTMTIKFTSSTEATITDTEAVGFYTTGKTTW